MINKRLEVIKKRIGSIKVQLAGIEDMRPGSLTRQYKDPENQRGPYYQLSYTRQMRSRTEYVPRDYLPTSIGTPRCRFRGRCRSFSGSSRMMPPALNTSKSCAGETTSSARTVV